MVPSRHTVGEERAAPASVLELLVHLGDEESAPERWLDGRDQEPVIASRQDGQHRARAEATEPVREEPLERLRGAQVPADLPAPCETHGCTTFRGCPSGSRIKSPFVKSSTRSAGVTTLEDAMEQLLPRTARATASASSLTSVVCQWARSLARASAGMGRPSRGVRYSRNSTPGPAAARSVVMRSRAPKTLFRRSCSGP